MKPTTKNKIFFSAYDTSNIPSGYALEYINDINNIKNNTIDEIFLKDIIGSYEDDDIIYFFKEIITKLRSKGIIYIQDIDIEQFCLYLSNKAIHINDKYLLYRNRRNIFSLSQILKILKDIDNISIKQINFVNGYEFYIMVEKNDI